MAIVQPDLTHRRSLRLRSAIIGSVGLLALAAVSCSKFSAPTVAKSSLKWDTVKRGEMLRQVRGLGALAPEELYVVQSRTDARVEKILVLPGALVKADTVLMELSNPELKQLVFDAEWQVKGGDAQLKKLKVQIESDQLAQRSVIASLKSEAEQADLQARSDESLARERVMSDFGAKKSRAKAEDLAARLVIEQERLRIMADSAEAQIAEQQSEIERGRAALALKQGMVDGLQVRAGVDGVLLQIGDDASLQTGQSITASAILARVVQPAKLKAELKVSETQAREVTVGQLAVVDLRNGAAPVPGHVLRVDPVTRNGLATIDVKLDGPLPEGARPDQTVEGTINLEKLADTVFVGRPFQGQGDTTVGLFKVIEGGREAIRVSVKLGRYSANTIQILEGLQVGDEISVSDMAPWGNHSRLRLN